MLPIKDSFNIVLLGAWNPSIFSQDWVLKNLAENEASNIAMAFPLDDPTAPRKIDFDGVSLFPGRKQLHIMSGVNTQEGMQNCSNIIVKILDLLSHTPVGNLGINFRFEEIDKLAQLNEILSSSDQAVINPENYVLSSTQLNRAFRLSDGNLLNLSLSDSGNRVQIGFNFHYEVNSIEEYKELFQKGLVSDRYNEAVQFCNDVYSLTLEEDGDNE